MVSLVEQGWADQIEVAGAFNQSVRTVRRQQRRFEDGGLAALGATNGYPPGRARLPAARQELVHKLKAHGHSNCEIARRLGVSETAVRKVLRRLGWNDSSTPSQLPLDPAQSSNPNLSALAASTAPQMPAQPTEDSNPNLSAVASGTTPLRSVDTDPANRRGDRLLAYLGLLEDAVPLFRSGPGISRAGVLLALPALIAGGVFECAHQVYRSLGPSFYGLRTSLLTLLLMALWRIKRPEGLKEHSPQDLGRVLGLDRAPEVKTLRRQLPQQIGRASCRERV
jgi:hypothetical protein